MNKFMIGRELKLTELKKELEAMRRAHPEDKSPSP
jgi:hypothetical protein